MISLVASRAFTPLTLLGRGVLGWDWNRDAGERPRDEWTVYERGEKIAGGVVLFVVGI